MNHTSRSIEWKRNLGLITDNREKWISQMSRHRDEYASLLEQWGLANGIQGNTQYSQLLSNIQNDIYNNLNIEGEEELKPEIHYDIIAKGLLLYSLINQDISYRSGMHQIYIVLYSTLLKEAKTEYYNDNSSRKQIPTSYSPTPPQRKSPRANGTRRTPPPPPPMTPGVSTADPKHIEPDTYQLFCKIMEYMKLLYIDENVMNGLANLIQSNVLVTVDPFLCDKLNYLEINPVHYIPYWCLNLFTNQFHINQVRTVWDGIFFSCRDIDVSSTLEYGPPLLMFLVTSLLLHISPSISAIDSSELCMNSLLSLKEISSIRPIVDQSKCIQDPYFISKISERIYVVEFVQGKLGLALKQKNNLEGGSLYVSEFQQGDGEKGQAEQSGLINIDDEVFAVNGCRLPRISPSQFVDLISRVGRPLYLAFQKPKTFKSPPRPRIPTRRLSPPPSRMNQSNNNNINNNNTNNNNVNNNINNNNNNINNNNNNINNNNRRNIPPPPGYKLEQPINSYSPQRQRPGITRQNSSPIPRKKFEISSPVLLTSSNPKFQTKTSVLTEKPFSKVSGVTNANSRTQSSTTPSNVANLAAQYNNTLKIGRSSSLPTSQPNYNPQPNQKSYIPPQSNIPGAGILNSITTPPNSSNSSNSNQFQQNGRSISPKNGRNISPQNVHNRKLSDGLVMNQSPDGFIPDTIPGENILHQIDLSLKTYQFQENTGVLLQTDFPGTLYCSNYRLLFHKFFKNIQSDVDVEGIYWQLPIHTILKIDTTKDSDGRPGDRLLRIVSKEGQKPFFRISNNNMAYFSKILSTITLIKGKGDDIEFPYIYYMGLSSNNLLPSNIIKYKTRDDFKRLGLLSNPNLRLIEQQRIFVCETYPPEIVIPAALSDDELLSVAGYRSRQRVPSVVYQDPLTGATLSRSSQPLVGIQSHRCPDDEKFLGYLLHISGRRQFIIIDARKKVASQGNRILGKGSELTKFYPGVETQYMNIGNIHAVRDSENNIHDIFRPGSLDGSLQWYDRLASSNWLSHISAILVASNKVAKYLHQDGISLLVHCSDGWDRTPQLTSLAQMLLDPYYRTLVGFEMLIQKEWLDYGHQFHLRCGHGSQNPNDEQRSPIFPLWLDCIWQLLRQFPTAFEFNENLLIGLFDQLYACRYGTFLFNSYMQRLQNKIDDRTIPIWHFIRENWNDFKNENYIPYDNCLKPNLNPRNLVLWENLFQRFDPSLFPPRPKAKTYY